MGVGVLVGRGVDVGRGVCVDVGARVGNCPGSISSVSETQIVSWPACRLLEGKISVRVPEPGQI